MVRIGWHLWSPDLLPVQADCLEPSPDGFQRFPGKEIPQSGFEARNKTVMDANWLVSVVFRGYSFGACDLFFCVPISLPRKLLVLL